MGIQFRRCIAGYSTCTHSTLDFIGLDKDELIIVMEVYSCLGTSGFKLLVLTVGKQRKVLSNNVENWYLKETNFSKLNMFWMAFVGDKTVSRYEIVTGSLVASQIATVLWLRKVTCKNPTLVTIWGHQLKKKHVYITSQYKTWEHKYSLIWSRGYEV